jgi:hypothetical protein
MISKILFALSLISTANAADRVIHADIIKNVDETSMIKMPASFTNDKVLILDGSGVISSSAVSSAELSYLSNVPVAEEEVITVSSTDITNQYIDLAHTVRPNTLVFTFYRKMILGDDYTISTVSGKTRVTFSGDIASAGVSAIVSGEKVAFNYYY